MGGAWVHPRGDAVLHRRPRQRECFSIRLGTKFTVSSILARHWGCVENRSLRLPADWTGWLDQRAHCEIDGFCATRLDKHESDSRRRRGDIPARREADLCGLSLVQPAQNALTEQDFSHDNEMLDIITAMNIFPVRPQHHARMTFPAHACYSYTAHCPLMRCLRRGAIPYLAWSHSARASLSSG